jgi:hypothetical protein
MKKTIRVEFNELSKSVTANTKIEYELEGEETEKYLNKDILQECKDLFDEAQNHAKFRTLNK